MMRWLRLQWYSICSGLKLWIDEPFGHLFNALVLAVAFAMPWAIIQGLSALLPSMDNWVGAPEISLYFKPDTEINRIKTTSIQLQSDFDVQSVTIVSPAEALQQLRTQNANPDLAKSLKTNPLPYTIVVGFKVTASTNTDLIQNKIQEWKAIKGVDHVQYDAQWVHRAQSILSGTQAIAAALGLVIISMVLIVTFNTVRLQLLRNQLEVHVLKALGATDTEVGRPTLWWSVSLALISFILAYCAVRMGMSAADQSIGQIIREFDRNFQFNLPNLFTITVMLTGWLFLVVFGAWVSIKKTLLRLR